MTSAPESQLPLADPCVGELLGDRYHLEERVGNGGMAVIYRATDQLLERTVAVKVLHPHLAHDTAVLGRFRTEARHAAALVHPHVVTVYDQGLGQRPFIVMELVDGPSLREVLRTRGPLSPRELLAVVDPVCRALAKAHDSGLIHRDVKPENVLITDDGVVKVADFGIARAAWAAEEYTQTGTLVGSVHYLAPELVAGREATDASDQYAVGVLCFELLTGAKPLPAESPVAIALRHGREPVPPPSSGAPGIAPALDSVVARATAMEPTRRYSGLRELADALAEAIPDGPLPVPIPDPERAEHLLIAPSEDTPTEGRTDAASPSTVVPDDVDTSAATATVRAPSTPPFGTSAPGADGNTATGLALPAAAIAAHEARARREERRAALSAVGAVARYALLIVVGLTIIAGSAWVTYDRFLLPVRTVPAVEGFTLDDAQRNLSRAGFGLVEAPPRHDYDTPAGTVISQQPADGTSLRSGETVTLTSSLGPPVVDVPTVGELTEERAIEVLAGDPYRFTVERVETAHHDQVPAGQAIGTEPAAGDAVTAATPVTLFMSLGVEQIEVPDIIGRSEEAAAERLRDAGFEVTISHGWSDLQPDPGDVARQSLDAGTVVDRGTTIDIRISRGPFTFTMPNMLGEDIDRAVAELEEMGLIVSVNEVARDTFGPFRRGQFGRVEDSSPEPGEDVERGRSVELWTYSQAAEERDERSPDGA